MLNYMIVVNDGDELKSISMLGLVENDPQFAELLDAKLNAILDARSFAESDNEGETHDEE